MKALVFSLQSPPSAHLFHLIPPPVIFLYRPLVVHVEEFAYKLKFDKVTRIEFYQCTQHAANDLPTTSMPSRNCGHLIDGVLRLDLNVHGHEEREEEEDAAGESEELAGGELRVRSHLGQAVRVLTTATG